MSRSRTIKAEDIKFVVFTNNLNQPMQWHWHALPKTGGRFVGSSGEGHNSKTYTIARAKAMAMGRLVQIRKSNPVSGKYYFETIP